MKEKIKEWATFAWEFCKETLQSGYVIVLFLILIFSMIFLATRDYCKTSDAEWCKSFVVPPEASVEVPEKTSTVTLNNVAPSYDYPTEPVRLSPKATGQLLMWLYGQDETESITVCGDWNHDEQLYELYICEKGSS